MEIVVYTLGCKVNQYESDGLCHQLKQMGHIVHTQIVPADIYILNSCAVTNEAEKKSRQAIAKFKMANPNAKIFVCGCASQKEPKQFENVGVTFIKGNANKSKMVQQINNIGTQIDELPTCYDENFYSSPTKARAHIKIQDGCNNFCAYCIIPYLRGRSRSRDVGDILQDVDKLSKIAKEIVITGIDITDFKINGKRALPQLLEKLKEFKNIRFRLGSLEQGLITQEFIDVIKNSNICPHFHLSLQSGSDSVLKRMNRKYTTAHFLESINLINQNFDCPTITTDIIVGFPEETEDEFNQTCEFALKAGFYNLHIFPYSKRSGTLAEKMGQVDGIVKKKRVKILSEINKKLNANFIEKSKNFLHNVLVEEFDGDYFIGHTENYIKCYIKEKCEINQMVKVKIINQYKDGALAQKEN